MTDTSIDRMPKVTLPPESANPVLVEVTRGDMVARVSVALKNCDGALVDMVRPVPALTF